MRMFNCAAVSVGGGVGLVRSGAGADVPGLSMTGYELQRGRPRGIYGWIHVHDQPADRDYRIGYDGFRGDKHPDQTGRRLLYTTQRCFRISGRQPTGFILRALLSPAHR